KIAIMIPAGNCTMEPEAYMIAPKGVAFYFAGMAGEGGLTIEGLKSQNEHIPECTRELMRHNPDIIVYGCTSGSLILGVGYDREIAKQIEEISGIKALTTSTAVIEALKTLEIKRVAVATPYPEEINIKEKEFLEGNGFKVTRIEGLPSPRGISIHRPEEAYRLARKVDSEENDGIFISCTNFRTLEIIEILEEDTGKPVVTSNQATFWKALRMIGIKAKIQGYGRLLREY
ncbi:MAG: aspartate/glutamate racemase family protein, partial [Candidatus Bathyarchaeia archaeon]